MTHESIHFDTQMGLGKTLQSISILVYMMEYRQISGPHLIVVPKSTMSNWMKEIKRWAPTLTACQFHGTREEREQIVTDHLEPAVRDEDRKWNIVLTTYEICNIEKNVLNKFAWSYLIIGTSRTKYVFAKMNIFLERRTHNILSDEAHRLKNEDSTFSKTIRMFETRYRLLLSGTPLQNSLHECKIRTVLLLFAVLFTSNVLLSLLISVGVTEFLGA